MDRIRIQNLRCLADTPPIEIKPVTLLVGANSSGKSTFLRVFPLLKQSAETRTVSGILLNEGDVNFGFFPEAVHRDANPSELKLSLGVELKAGLFQGAYVHRFLLSPIQIMCEICYNRRIKDTRYPYVSSINLTIGKDRNCDNIYISADEDGKITKFQINSYIANEEVSHLMLKVGRGVIPTLAGTPRDSNEDVDELADVDDLNNEEELLFGSPFERMLLHVTDSLFHGRTSRNTKLSVLRSIKIGNPEQMLSHMRRIGSVPSWNQNISSWTIDSPMFKKVRNHLLAKYIPRILIGLNDYSIQLASSIHYFQPVRANVERDYLSRDVQISSVDPSGNNVAMVLSSLSSTSLKEFRKWMLKHFGFEVYPEIVGDGARIALRMKEEGSTAEFNLADMGFGFSQMLPFLVQIWYIVEYEGSRLRNRFYYQSPPNAAFPTTYIVAIEQPELHLHPALQSKLADLFVAIAKLSRKRNLPVRFVLETHSPTIIERIGSHIEAKSLDSSDVQVLLFERGANHSEHNSASVRFSEFDKDGVLTNWPFGFLSPPPFSV